MLQAAGVPDGPASPHPFWPASIAAPGARFWLIRAAATNWASASAGCPALARGPRGEGAAAGGRLPCGGHGPEQRLRQQLPDLHRPLAGLHETQRRLRRRHGRVRGGGRGAAGAARRARRGGRGAAAGRDLQGAGDLGVPLGRTQLGDVSLRGGGRRRVRPRAQRRRRRRRAPATA